MVVGSAEMARRLETNWKCHRHAVELSGKQSGGEVFVNTSIEGWKTSLSEIERFRFAALWGKSGDDNWSKGRTGPTLLVQHLLDTLSVGELLWDEFLAPVVRNAIDATSAGNGRRLFAWLCGIHDLGKASPAFQSQDRNLAEKVIASGLPISTPAGTAQKWRHERASGLILLEHLGEAWSREDSIAWIWPLAAGHHGQFPSKTSIGRYLRSSKARDRRRMHGAAQDWGEVQVALLRAVTTAAGFASLDEAEPASIPSRATQLALSGYIVMADWLASSDKLEAIPSFEDVELALARERARRVLDAAHFGHGLQGHAVPTLAEAAARFDLEPRPLQTAMHQAATTIDAPGLIICEAPTGEGKTEAALMAAEVLAARFGADGVFVALPTQATANAMLERVVPWLDQLGPGLEFALVHGGRSTAEAWQAYRNERKVSVALQHEPALDQYGMPDDFDLLPESGFSGIGVDCTDHNGLTALAASDWFDGRKRGLLARNAVGTIDQLLFAGTRTKHVMLRYAGLAGKVVIIDEVHAVDTYMATFLSQVLAWLGLGRVPVVLLSATLAPNQREDLVASYLRGALDEPRHDAAWARDLSGQPLIATAWANDGTAEKSTFTTSQWRAGKPVTIERIEAKDDNSELTSVATTLAERLIDGGCALVIRNTVDRACATYDALVDEFGADDVRLLHGRLAAGHRASLTDDLVARLGPPSKPPAAKRPRRLIVVATQVAEQSFDVDADLLVTDLAPIDLLIQRAGRMHRHDRPPSDRPAPVSAPRMILTGLDLAGDEPWFPPGSTAVYGNHLLVRTAAVLLEAMSSGGIVLPNDAPQLVAAVYGDADVVPEGWRQFADGAKRRSDEALETSASAAKQYVLVGDGSWNRKTLEGLHDYPAGTEDAVRVREGDMGTEVVIVIRGYDGYRTIDGESLGMNGERASAAVGTDTSRRMARAVLAGTVRLPGTASRIGAKLNRSADSLGTLSEWADHSALRHLHVLVLDSELRGTLGETPVRYDGIRGLLVGAAA